MLQSSINILEWPAKSSDLNITEDIWKLISGQVYDGPQFLNINQLKTKLKNVIDNINININVKKFLIYINLLEAACVKC